MKSVILLCITLGSLYALQADSIEGRVVNAASGEGVRKASLTLTATGGKSEAVTAQSGDSGQFVFNDLAPGSYRLRADRNGFQSRTLTLMLPSSRAVQDLTLKLLPNAVLSGRVLDMDGEPMPNLRVVALRSGYVRGKREWLQVASATADDRGDFRIPNLRAGRYAVCANGLVLGIGLAGASNDAVPEKPEPAYVNTCHPNATDLAQAEPVEVRMGENRRGTDIQMAKSATVRIRGRVTGAPEGRILLAMAVRSGYPAGGSMPAGFAQVQPETGAFELRNLTPGSYVITVRAVAEMTAFLAAPLPLELGERHIEGVEVPCAEGGTVSGHINGKKLSVALDWADLPLPGVPATAAGDDGRFALKGVFPGRYRVRVENIGADAYVESIRIGGREVDESGVDLPGGGELEIVVSRTGAQVKGQVLVPDGKPMADAHVMLIPESARESHYRFAETDHDGNFHVKGIPPGKYQALAFEELEPGAHLDREFVKRFEARAQTLALEENGKSEVTLKGIPTESN